MFRDRRECSIHQRKLEPKKASILFGYPASNILEVGALFPNHGLWASLGGCVVEVDENLEPLNQMEDIEVCNECTQDALKYLNRDE